MDIEENIRAHVVGSPFIEYTCGGIHGCACDSRTRNDAMCGLMCPCPCTDSARGVVYCAYQRTSFACGC